MRNDSDEQYRKWAVLVAVYCGIILQCSSTYMSGILFAAMQEKYRGEKAWTSLVLSLNSGLMCLLGPVVTTVINRCTCRVSVVMGGVLLTVAGLSSAFVESVDALIVTYGIIGGIGNALAAVPGSIILSYYFKDHRNIILALYVTSVGCGMFIASPLSLLFLDKFALNGTFLMIGALNSHLCIIGCICKPSKVENELRQNRHKPKPVVAKDQNGAFEYETNSNKYRIKKSFGTQNIRFPMFLISTFTWNAVLSIFVVHLPTFASNQGSSATKIAAMMILLGVGSTVGRLIGAAAVGYKRINPLLFHALCLCSTGVVAIVFPMFESTDYVKYILAGAVGLLNGPPNSMMTPITLKLVGIKAISTAHGWEFFFCGAGFLGPPIVGAIFDQTGSYRSGFIFTGILSLVGGVIAMVIDKFLVTKKPHPKSKETKTLVINETNLSSA